MMRGTILLLLFILSASRVAVCQDAGKPAGAKPGAGSGVKCAENRDKLYARRDVLEQFAAILNASVPEFESMYKYKFYVRGGKARAFGVYDLTDPSNVDSTDTCIELADNHVYHVVPLINDYSFSHIIVLEGGNLKVFKSINCRNRGDKLEDVIEYLNLKLAADKNKGEIINRVMNYRKHGTYVRMDNFSRLMCDPVADKP